MLLFILKKPNMNRKKKDDIKISVEMLRELPPALYATAKSNAYKFIKNGEVLRFGNQVCKDKDDLDIFFARFEGLG